MLVIFTFLRIVIGCECFYHLSTVKKTITILFLFHRRQVILVWKEMRVNDDRIASEELVKMMTTNKSDVSI